MAWISLYEPTTKLGADFLKLASTLVQRLETDWHYSKTENEVALRRIGERLDALEKENEELKKLVHELGEKGKD